MSNAYQSKYLAYELTRRLPADQAEKLSQSLCNATVDLNPHQIEAALFAFRSPLSRGAILADEVGLGKTIEAGLVISQLWAERKRRILCIVPASLRKQWNRELADKFYIGSTILESRSYNQARKQGTANPFDIEQGLIIVSYQFAGAKMNDMQAVAWDLVVIDEAHRLRNVYKKGNKIARNLRDAIGSRPKILLTATPLQNSLMELYGLVTFVDDKIFAGEDSFREQFAARPDQLTDAEFAALKSRLQPICKRTLRRQVREYVPYTSRLSITQDFTPKPEEQELYRQVSEYLQKPDLYALPTGQRQLITLVLRKILASSSFAIGSTLSAMITRLEGIRAVGQVADLSGKVDDTSRNEMVNLIANDIDHADELEEEWAEPDATADEMAKPDLTADQRAALVAEIEELKKYRMLAESIQTNSKGEALLMALKTGFTKAQALGAPAKALIFTESRRTQRYLQSLLEQNGYAGKIVFFNGTNADPASKDVFKKWRQRHAGQDMVSGSPSADMRSALVEEFAGRASIMIATESAAEGINLQFCSLVVNYDLPWNPQRIEQRIGRCHRYGQKYDVVVVNFLNRANQADQRVFELLDQKFKLFDGVFGASDEVLGALESGVDFEKRINAIYQNCRSAAEIDTAFNQLQNELEVAITSAMRDARTKLLENFDDEVRLKLRLRRDQTTAQLSRFAEMLWELTRNELADRAAFQPDGHAFALRELPPGLPLERAPLGSYRLVLDKDQSADIHYRAGHPLAEFLIGSARARPLSCCEVIFDYESYSGQLSVVEQLRGQLGWMRLVQLTITSFEAEDHLAFGAITDDGRALDPEICGKLLHVPAQAGAPVAVEPPAGANLVAAIETARRNILGEAMNRNEKYFEAEMAKLDLWAEDLKNSLEGEIRAVDLDLKAAKRDAQLAGDLATKLELQKKARSLEKQHNDKRKNLFKTQDEIDAKKDRILEETASRLKQQVAEEEIFTIRWRIV